MVGVHKDFANHLDSLYRRASETEDYVIYDLRGKPWLASAFLSGGRGWACPSGTIFQLLAFIDWESQSLASKWLHKPMKHMRCYEAEIAREIEAAGLEQ